MLKVNKYTESTTSPKVLDPERAGSFKKYQRYFYSHFLGALAVSRTLVTRAFGLVCYSYSGSMLLIKSRCCGITPFCLTEGNLTK